MKKNHLKFTFLVSIVLFMFTAVFVGCETDEGETADTTELNALIDSCQDLQPPMIIRKQLLMHSMPF